MLDYRTMQLMNLIPHQHESFMFIYDSSHFELLTIFSYDIELKGDKPIYSELPLHVHTLIEN